MMTKTDILRMLYDSLAFQLEKLNKRKNTSILMDFMKIKSNDRLNILNASADYLKHTELKMIKELNDQDLIKENEFGMYYISAIGIWNMESSNFDVCKEIVEFFDSEFFTNKSVNVPLKTREKIIIMTLITIRSFNVETALDLKSNDITKDSCADIMDSFYSMFLKLEVIKKSKDDLYGKSGNEHKVSNVIRHSEELPKKTKMLYVNGYKKEQKYYLDLSNDGVIDRENLKYIFGKIFEGTNLNYSDIKMISEVLIDLTYKTGPNIYSEMNKTFIQSKFDEIILDCLKETIMGI